VIRPRGLYGARPDSPSTIQDTKRYLHDFDRLQKTARPARSRSIR
jgi:hypothetical protein